MLTLEGQLQQKVDKNDVNAIMNKHDAGGRAIHFCCQRTGTRTLNSNLAFNPFYKLNLPFLPALTSDRQDTDDGSHHDDGQAT